MTDAPQPSRPQQVTTAVVLSVVACVLVVANLLSTRAELRGSSFREALTEAQQRAGGMGLSTDKLVTALEVLVFVAGALAAAAGVLAVYVWQRNRAARVAFFVLAGLLVLTFPVSGVLPVLMLATGATFLASRPAREWFAGREPVVAGSGVALTQEGGGRPSGFPEPPPYPGRFGGGTGASAGPPPEQQPGPPPEQQSDQQPGHQPGREVYPPTYGAWHGAAPLQGQVPTYGGHLPPPFKDPDKRPPTVTAACVATWVGSALVAALLGLLALVLVAERSRYLREFQRQADEAQIGVSQDQMLAMSWTLVGIGLAWCLAAAVLAVAAFRRSRGGRTGLAVSAGVTVLVSLLMILSVVAVVPLLLGVAVLVLLFTGGANDWYARRLPSGGSSWGPPPPGSPYGGQQATPTPPSSPQPPPPAPPPPGRARPW